MDALILAAGQGTRLGLNDSPKCLIEFGTSSLIEYQIKCLNELGIKNIHIITGYFPEKIKSKIGDSANYIHNPEFSSTNNICSILCAKNFMSDDFICIYGDLFFDKKILKNCLSSTKDIVLTVEKNLREETSRVKIKDNKIILVNKNINFNEADGNFIGMAKFSKNITKKLFNSIEKIAKNDSQSYYTSAIEDLIQNGTDVHFVTTENLSWMDIDTPDDLIHAQELFVSQ
tara:strand:+ start:680 stop:1369 length:690 start_codon:yes stop_codon:yes gene_type:complete